MTSDPDQSADLLKRAYNLKTQADTLSLYADWATTYDETMVDGLEYLTPPKTARLLAGAAEDRNLHILDVGCGTGLAGEALAELGFTHIDALDFSPQMLKTAAAKQIKGQAVYKTLIEADLNQPLSIGDNSYDALICTGTFTHAHVGSDCLHELFRILKPGGLFACTIHREVWQAQGFEATVEKLLQDGAIRTREMTMDIYFKTDTEPQGWFILWEKAG